MAKIKFSLKLSFAEAVKWAEEHGVILPEDYRELEGLYKNLAFTFAEAASLQQVQAVLDSLVTALIEGESFDTWKQSTSEIPLNLPNHRLELIFRNTVQGAFQHGKWQFIEANIAEKPFMMYDAVDDSRTRHSHAAMDGFVARVDASIWDEWYPPNGHNCRCTVIALDEEQISSVRKTPYDEIARGEAIFTGPDKGWAYHIGKHPQEQGIIASQSVASTDMGRITPSKENL